MTFPDEDTIAPVRVRVDRARARSRSAKRARARTSQPRAEAELGPPATRLAFATGGGYDGPLAYRQGKPMRPDVALAFDRMEAAARADGIALLINSGYRSDAEQAVLWARHPDPKWVAPARHVAAPQRAPSSTSARRRPTPGSRRTPARFHFIQRYAWEPWHFGYTLNAALEPEPAATRPGDGAARRLARRGARVRPARFAPDAAQRGAALERVGDAAGRAALRGVGLQPVRRHPGGRAGHRAVHARDRARRWACDEPVRRRRRRSTRRRT